MELHPTPQRHPRRPSPIVLASLVLFALAGLVLAPQALGLHHDLVRDGAMGATWRGAVVLADDEPGGDLDVGDVILFEAPAGPSRAAGTVPVARRVVAVEREVALTRADGAAAVDPWELPLDTPYARVVARVPYVGRVLDGGRVALVAVVAVGLLVTVLVLLVVRRRSRRGAAGVSRPTTPAVTRPTTPGEVV